MKNTLTDKINIVSLTKKRGELALEEQLFTQDEAIMDFFYRGFIMICDQRRYSHDNFKKYTRKWHC